MTPFRNEGLLGTDKIPLHILVMIVAQTGEFCTDKIDDFCHWENAMVTFHGQCLLVKLFQKVRQGNGGGFKAEHPVLYSFEAGIYQPRNLTSSCDKRKSILKSRKNILSAEMDGKSGRNVSKYVF